MIRYSYCAFLALGLSTQIYADNFNFDNETVTTSQTLDEDESGSLTSTAILSVADNNTIEIEGNSELTNYGIIEQTGDGRAIKIGKKNSILTLDNYGTITALGDDVIKVSKSSSGIVLNNQGTIWQKGTAPGSGQALDLSDITASGSSIINGSATNTSALIRADGDDALRPGSNMSITNYGTIISTGTVNTKCTGDCSDEAKAQDGIDLQESTGVSIYNYGTISGPRHGITADIDVSVINYEDSIIIGNNGSGIGSDGNGTVINYGTITGDYAGEGNVYDHSASNNGTSTADNGDGDGVDIDGIATIYNYGTIQGLDAGGVDSSGYSNGAEGIAAGGGTIINYENATIYGQSVGILIDDGANGTVTGRGTSDAIGEIASITNSGTIQGATKAAIGLVGDYNDTLINYTTGIIIGGGDAVLVDELSSTTAGAAVQMGNGDDTFINYGTVEGENDLAIDMGSGDDTLTLLGGSVVGSIDGGDGEDSLVLGASQILKVSNNVTNFENLTTQDNTTTLETAIIDGIAQTLLFSNSVTLNDETSIQPVITGGILDNGAYTILSAGTLNATASSLNIIDTYALFNFSIDQSDNNLILTTTYDYATYNALSSSDKHILDTLEQTNGSTGASSLLDAIYSSSNQRNLANALEQLTPNTNNMLTQALIVAQNTIFSAFSHRMGSYTQAGSTGTSQSGLSAGESYEGRLWAELLGNTVRQNSYKNSDGYRINTAGVVMGYEIDLNPNEIIGISGGYTGIRGYGKNASEGDHTTVNSLHLGTYYYKDASTYTLSGSLVGSINHYNGTRLIAIPEASETLDSIYNGYALGILAEVGFPIINEKSYSLKPLIGMQYSYNHTKSYNEKDALAALHVNASDNNSFKSILGAQLFKNIDDHSSYFIGLRYLHEFADDGMITAGFLSSGSSFSIANVETSKDALQASLSYQLLTSDDAKFSIGYVLEAKEKYLAHQLSLKMNF
ncbi:MAG: autotransporter domain-containing protein [Campylobacterales bacterium]|nr:autotransporter domain-containing protein [Campylobacterales bacterium]